MARKRPLRNPLPPPPPSPSPSPPSIRKEESEKGNDIAEDEDNEEQMSTDNEEEEEEEEEEDDDDDDDDEEVQKVEKKHLVGEFKATVPTPSKSDSGSDSDNHFTIKPVVSKLSVPKPTKKMTEKAVTGGSDVELILGLACEGWEMGVKKPKRTSNSRLKTAVKTDNLKTAVKTDNLRTEVTTEEEVDEVEGSLEKYNLKTEVTTEEKVDEVEGSLEKYTALDEWLEMGGVAEGVKWVMRKRLREIEKSKVRGLEERWRSLRKAELELFLQKMDFVSEQLKLVLESASNSAEF